MPSRRNSRLQRSNVKTLRTISLIAGALALVSAPLSAAPSQLAAGGYHVVGVHSGRVLGLGDGTYGQLGTNPAGAPATVAGLTGVTHVAAGRFSTIALKLDGTVWFLGEATLQHTTPHGTPSATANAVQVAGLSGIDALAAGHRHFLALDLDSGELFAWGHNGSGQVGDGGLLDVTTPVLILTGVASMAAGDGFSLAVKSDSTVFGWGRNRHGQLGLGDTADRVSPTQIPGASSALAVAAGGQHSLILLTNGSVLATGNNAFGQLGLGNTTSTSTPTTVPGLGSITTIAAGYHHSGALSSSSVISLWGRNFEGQCGGGISSSVTYPSPRVLTTLPAGLDSLACGAHFTVFVLVDGTVWGTGSNADGQLDGVSVADQDSSQKVLAAQLVPLSIDPPGGLGVNYCMATVNSSGLRGQINAAGSEVVSDNDLTLEAVNLPTNVFGFFLASQTPDLIPFPPGSIGNLCLGGTIARFVAQVQGTGAAGSFSISVDLTRIPMSPPVAVMVGETWYYTTWFRDQLLGIPFSNFTNGYRITFE